MKGTRDRTKAFEIPLLMELAVRNDERFSWRYKSAKEEILEEIRYNVMAFFGFSESEKRLQLESDAHGQIYQEIHRARHFLVLKNEMVRDHWEITQEGLVRLQDLISDCLKHILVSAPDRLADLIRAGEKQEPSSFIQVLRQVPEDRLAPLVHKSSNQFELLALSFQEIPAANLGTAIMPIWEELVEIVGEHLKEKHKYSLAMLQRRANSVLGA